MAENEEMNHQNIPSKHGKRRKYNRRHKVQKNKRKKDRKKRICTEFHEFEAFSDFDPFEYVEDPSCSRCSDQETYWSDSKIEIQNIDSMTTHNGDTEDTYHDTHSYGSYPPSKLQSYGHGHGQNEVSFIKSFPIRHIGGTQIGSTTRQIAYDQRIFDRLDQCRRLVSSTTDSTGDEGSHEGSPPSLQYETSRTEYEESPEITNMTDSEMNLLERQWTKSTLISIAPVPPQHEPITLGEALTTWKSYVDRCEYTKIRYPEEMADRNNAWLQWSKMVYQRDEHQNHDLSRNLNESLCESELWHFIDFARMSCARYSNWIWWPQPLDQMQLDMPTLHSILKAKRMRSVDDGNSDTDGERTYLSQRQYFDHQLDMIWTKKFAIIMDFNLFLFESYASPEDIEETLAFEHSLLSLASSTNVVVSKKNTTDFYLNTSGQQDGRYLRFRCDVDDDEINGAKRNEWMEELQYQIHIVHKLLSIPGIKLKVADPNATLWLPVPAVKVQSHPPSPSAHIVTVNALPALSNALHVTKTGDD